MFSVVSLIRTLHRDVRLWIKGVNILLFDEIYLTYPSKLHRIIINI
jgi:hypothetical protein